MMNKYLNDDNCGKIVYFSKITHIRYVLLSSNDDTVCIANVIIDLCNDRDNCSFHMVNKIKLHNIINVMCIG